VIFRGGPSITNPNPKRAVLRDELGLVGRNTDLGFGYITSHGSNQNFVRGAPDFPEGSKDDVASMTIPNILQTFDQIRASFVTASQRIDSLRTAYHPVSQNSNSFAHTLIVKANLIAPDPSVWAPGWENILY
jgi:hypothetical protein